MGVLIADHRGGSNFDGSKGTLVELDTVSCPHCQGLIAVVLRGCTKQVRSPYRCGRCNAALCKLCAAAMEKTKVCPGPFVAKIDEAMRTEKWHEEFQHNYRR